MFDCDFDGYEDSTETLERRIQRLFLRDDVTPESSQVYTVVDEICRKGDLHSARTVFPALLSPNAKLKRYQIEGVHSITAVFLAVRHHNESNHCILEYLLDIGADIHFTVEEPPRPSNLLECAFLGRKAEAAAFLLARGAVIHDDVAILKLACKGQADLKLITLVTKHVDINVEGALPLHWALPLDTRGVGDDIDDDLYIYALLSLLKTAKGRVDVGDAPSDKDEHLKVVRFLLESGADPNRKDSRRQMSPGHMVSRGHKVELYKLLLAHGWDIHTTDVIGYTALHYAVIGNDVDVIKYLVDMGARMDTKAVSDGFLPFHATTICSYFKNDSYFSTHAFMDDNLEDYNRAKIDCLDYMLATGVNIDSADKYGDTLTDLLYGHKEFYQTLAWFVQKSVKLPSEETISDTESYLYDHNDDFISTDCLIPAGFHNSKFIQAHLKMFITVNNFPEYDATMFANPYAIYKLDMEEVEEATATMKQFCDTFDENHMCLTFNEEALYEIVRHPREHDMSVYKRAMIDIESPPTLKQLTVYTIRCHLLVSTGYTTLFYSVDHLPLATSLKELLTLKCFVDFTTENHIRNKVYDD